MVNSGQKTNADAHQGACRSCGTISSITNQGTRKPRLQACSRLKWYAEKDLFEPGKAVLTANGKKALGDAAKWLNQQKDEGAEIVVASFAEPTQKSEVAQNGDAEAERRSSSNSCLTKHQVHRTGWWWWSTLAPSVAVSCGIYAVAEMQGRRTSCRQREIELIVFVPQG